ncbi:MAG: hypothetical protein JRH10_21720 [Deltaproteobacteria bacterium]|nr:hypothetical protein [Deltaproteobacteria bacterium]
MRRVLLWGLGLLVIVGVGFGVYARLFAGGPIGPLPGGTLSGELSTELPDDWTFANQVHNLDVESRAFRLPYSTGTWFMAYEGRIHILLPSFFVTGLESRLAADPKVRIRLAGKLYDQVAVRVDEGLQRGAILAPFVRRQMAIEISGEVRNVERPESDTPVGMTVYRLEDPAS